MTQNKRFPILPKATAIWLIENTSLTFKQIAEFCGIHELEVKGIADGEVSHGMMGLDPVAGKQLSLAEIKRCSDDPNAKLQLLYSAADSILENKKKKQSKYIPIARRQDKPSAIYWLIKNYPEITDQQIVKLIRSTKSTIESIRSRTHWNISNIRPQDPVILGLCTQVELDKVTEKLRLQSDDIDKQV